MRRKINLILLFVAVCATASARQEYKRDYRKSTTLPSGRAVRLESQFGRISIRAVPGNQVVVQAVVRCSADTLEEARRLGEQIQIYYEETAAGVYVRSDYPHLSGRFHNLSYAIDYDITMPETALLDLRNRFGAIDVSNLHASATISSGNGTVAFLNGRGRQRIENSFGMVEVRKNDGDVVIHNSNGPTIAADITGAVEITNQFGEIRATNIGLGISIRSNNSNIEVTNAGGPATVSNSFGRVVLADIKAGATVQNQNGEISADGISGAADLHTSFAGIRFSRIGKSATVRATNSLVRGDTVGEFATVETTFGGVDLRDVKGAARVTAGNTYIKLSGIGGEVYTKTNFAPVNITDSAGPITVEDQNGAVTVNGRQIHGCQPISLRTTFGPIRVTLPQGAGYDLTSHTTFGSIHSDLPIVTPPGTHSGQNGQAGLAGKINGGGCDLKLMGENGSIDILR